MGINTKKLILAVMLFFATNFITHSQCFWGNSMKQASISESITIDNLGNSYTIGSFTDSINVSSNDGQINLYSIGDRDILIRKFDPTGNLIWAKSIGGLGYDIPGGLRVDNENNLFFSGNFTDTIHLFDGNTIDLISYGSFNAFLCKLNSFGDFQWIKSFENNNGIISRSLDIDNLGNVISIGRYTNEIDLDPSSNLLTSTTNGSTDLYIQKLDFNGNFIWGKTMGGTNNDNATKIRYGNNGDIYCSGYYIDNFNFNQTNNQFYLNHEGDNVFLLKLNASGQTVWVKNIGGSEYGSPVTDFEIDSNDNIYLASSFYGLNDLDSIFQSTNQSYGDFDILFCKFDSSGILQWSKTIGGAASIDIIYSIDVNTESELCMTGYFSGVVDFNPESGVNSISSNGNEDVYLSKYDSNGNYIYAQNFGAEGSDGGSLVSFNNQGDIFLIGLFNDTVDFYPGVNNYFLPSTAGNDFIIKFLDENIIINNPINQNSILGGNAQFTISTLTDDGSFQWQLNNGLGFQNIIDGNQFSGSLNDTLIISNLISSNNSQQFRCIVNSVECSDTSDIAILTIDNSTNDIDLNQLANIQLFPNPTKSSLSISGINSDFSYKISDLQGKLLKQGTNEKQIEIENLPAGTYVIGISTDNEVKQLRFVKI